MKLVKAQIKNFRSIGDAEVSFEPRLRVLVGINEAGKSNILAALGLLDPARNVSPSDIREPSPQEPSDADAYVRFIFQLDAREKDIMRGEINRKFFPTSVAVLKTPQKTYTAETLLSLFSQGIYRIDVKDSSRSSTRWAIHGSEIAKGWYSKKPDASLPNPLELKDGTKLKSDTLELMHGGVLREEDLQFFEHASLERVEEIYDTPLRRLVKKSLPGCMYWTYSEASLLPGQIPIAEFRANPAAFLPLKEMFALADFSDPDAAFSDYEKRSHGRRNLLHRVSLAATAHLKASWPECKGIEVLLSPNGENIDASIKDKHNQYSFDKRSDGFKRFITFLLLVSARISKGTLENVLFIQDEPDLGLHPSGVKHLLSSLIALSEKNYAVVATHSIFLVDKERVDRHLIVKKHDELTSLQDIDPSNITDEEVIYNALGYSLFDALKPKNIVFEGWRDKRLFAVSLGKKNDVTTYIKNALKSSLGLCHAKGLKDIPRIATFLQLAGRNGIAVVDSDEPARKLQKNERDGHVVWHRYDELLGVDEVLTAEDFIVRPRLLSALNSVLRQNGYAEMKAQESFIGVPAIQAAENWLKGLGIDKDESKRLVNEWKSEIFDNLRTGEILDRYVDVQSAIKRRVEECA